MTLQASSPTEAAIACCRFGLGARSGELALAGSDPRGWLKAQIVAMGADQPPGALPSGPQQFVAYRSALAQFRGLKQVAVAGGSAPPMRAQAEAGSMTAATLEPDAVTIRLKQERRALLQPIRQNLAAEALARARLGATTSASFRERWTLFWANHFTVSTAKAKAVPLVGPFEREAIRPHVFGRFEDLLVASTTHPAMLLYLDQPRSAGPNSPAGRRRELGLNENLAREVMELHSVGADAGYTQADVTEFARALTGYSIGLQRDGAQAEGTFIFRPQQHEPGARTVMGRTYAEGGADQARAVLRDLAASPHTADHVARRIGAHFVADDPPPALTAHLRKAYLDSQGDLSVVAAALIDAPEAWSLESAKFKRPYEFVLSAYRTIGTEPADGQREVLGPLTRLGERPMAAPQPNGWSDQGGDWMAPDAVVRRLIWASQFAQARAPQGAPVDVAAQALGSRLQAPTRLAIARAETRPEALTLLLMSSEFQRR